MFVWGSKPRATGTKEVFRRNLIHNWDYSLKYLEVSMSCKLSPFTVQLQSWTRFLNYKIGMELSWQPATGIEIKEHSPWQSGLKLGGLSSKRTFFVAPNSSLLISQDKSHIKNSCISARRRVIFGCAKTVFAEFSEDFLRKIAKTRAEIFARTWFQRSVNLGWKYFKVALATSWN